MCRRGEMRTQWKKSMEKRKKTWGREEELEEVGYWRARGGGVLPPCQLALIIEPGVAAHLRDS